MSYESLYLDKNHYTMNQTVHMYITFLTSAAGNHLLTLGKSSLKTQDKSSPPYHEEFVLQNWVPLDTILFVT